MLTDKEKNVYNEEQEFTKNNKALRKALRIDRLSKAREEVLAKHSSKTKNKDLTLK